MTDYILHFVDDAAETLPRALCRQNCTQDTFVREQTQQVAAEH